MLHLILNKSSCGCEQSALLLHTLIVEALAGIGFDLNTNYLCAANVDFDGVQCTAVRNAHDRNLPYESTKVAKHIVSKLEDRFDTMPSKLFRPEHDFLGVKLKFKEKKVSADARECPKKHRSKIANCR